MAKKVEKKLVKCVVVIPDRNWGLGNFVEVWNDDPRIGKELKQVEVG